MLDAYNLNPLRKDALCKISGYLGRMETSGAPFQNILSPAELHLIEAQNKISLGFY